MKNAFAEFSELSVTTYNDDAERKRRLLLNFSEPESSMSMVMNELCRGKTFAKTCFMIRKHGLTKGTNSRQVNAANMESIVEEAVRRVQLSMQDTAPEEQNEADDLSAAVNLSRVMPDLWQQLPRDIQKIIINARAKERKESSTPKVSTQGIRTRLDRICQGSMPLSQGQIWQCRVTQMQI